MKRQKEKWYEEKGKMIWKREGKKPILQFLGITFGISWGVEILVILLEQLKLLPDIATKVIAMICISVGAALAPGMAVYLLMKKHGLIHGMKDYLRGVFTYKSKRGLIVGLLLTFAYFAGFVLFTESPQPGMPLWLAPFMLLFMIPGGGWEELGWRAFLQPALEERFGCIPGTLMMGGIWAVWHTPLWFVQSANQKNFLFWSFALYCIGLSFLLAVVNKLTGCVFAAILLHAWGNTMCGGLYSFKILTDGPGVIAGLFGAGAVVMLVITDLLAKEK